MNQAPKEIWASCLSFIKNNIGERPYMTWFAPIEFYSYDRQTLRVKVPNQFLVEYVEGHYLKLLRIAIKHFFGDIQLRYHVEADKTNNISTELDTTTRSVIIDNISKTQANNITDIYAASNKLKTADLDPHLNPNNTFENFIEGESNKLPRTIALAIAEESYQNTFNPFFIYGISGVGKTHLVNALGTKIKEKTPQKRVLYVSAHLLQIQYTDSILNNKFNDFMNFYQSIDVLIVDDIQEIAGKTKTQEAFFNIFNHLHLNQKQLIITCDCPPVSLEGMTERLLSRFKWGMIAELEQPNAKLRKDILYYKIKHNGLQFPQNVINYIATNVNGSIRNLEGTINSIMAYSIVYNSEINMDLVESVVAKVVNTKQKTVYVDEILDTVCKHYSIKNKEVISSSRRHNIVQARQISMYLTQKYTNLSSSQIGSKIGKRDHSTVLHSCNLVEKRLNVDKKFRSELETIEHAIFQIK